MARPRATLALVLCALAAAVVAPGGAAAEDGSLGDAEVAFTRGVLLFHDGDPEAARAAFAEAAAARPDDGTYRHWLGLAALRQGDFAAAERALEAALEAPLAPAAGAERVRADLERARREDDRVAAPVGGGELFVFGAVPRLDGRLSLGVGNDSNPLLLAEGVALATPDGRLVVGEEDDTFGSVDLRLGLQPFAGGGDDGDGSAWTLGLVADARQSAYDGLGHLDAGSLAARVQLARGRDARGWLAGPLGYSRVPFGADRLLVLLQAGYGREWVDGEAFADVASAGAALRLSTGRWGATQLEGSWRDVELETDLGALAPVGETTEARLWQYLYLGAPSRWLRVGWAAGTRAAGRAYDAELEELAAELALPLGRRATLFLAGARRDEDYDHPESNVYDPGSGDRRRDETTRYGGALAVRLGASFFVTGRATRIERETELALPFGAPPLDYERQIVSLGLSWVF